MDIEFCTAVMKASMVWWGGWEEKKGGKRGGGWAKSAMVASELPGNIVLMFGTRYKHGSKKNAHKTYRMGHKYYNTENNQNS